MTNDLIQDDFFPDEGSAVPETEDCSADAVPAGTSPKKRKKETADERGGKRLSDTAQGIINEQHQEPPDDTAAGRIDEPCHQAPDLPPQDQGRIQVQKFKRGPVA